MHSNFLVYTFHSFVISIKLLLIFIYLNSSSICYSQFSLSVPMKEQLQKAQPRSCSRGQSHSSWWSQKKLFTTYRKSDFTLRTRLIQQMVQQNIKDLKSTVKYLNLTLATKEPVQFSRVHVPILFVFIPRGISMSESEWITDPNNELQITNNRRCSLTMRHEVTYPFASFMATTTISRNRHCTVYEESINRYLQRSQ